MKISKTMLLLGIVLLAMVLAVIILVNTLRLPSLPDASGSRPPPVAGLDAAAGRLSAAVQLPTISYGFATPAGKNHFPALHALLETSFPLVHKALKREKIAEYSLLYTWTGSDPLLPPILLTGHLDVVPIEPGTEAKWTHPPFSGAIADGYVWGRGTLDNKHMVMATLEGVERLLADGFTPRRTILIAFGHDEEIGGPLGAASITKELQARKIKAWFSLDEGTAMLEGLVPGVTRSVAQIGLSEKGFMTLQLKAKAPGGHSSMPPPSTAVGKLGRAIARLEANPVPGSLAGPGGASLRAMAPALPFGLRAVIANEWLFGPILLAQSVKMAQTNALVRTTTAPTVINGGVKENVLPSEATALVNFRLAPGDTIAGIKAHVEKVIDDPDVSIGESGMRAAEATAVADVNGPGFALIGDAIRQIDPAAVITPGLVLAGTDSKHYGEVSEAAYHFTAVRLSPANLGTIHATDERISIENYGEIIGFYLALIRNAAR